MSAIVPTNISMQENRKEIDLCRMKMEISSNVDDKPGLDYPGTKLCLFFKSLVSLTYQRMVGNSTMTSENLKKRCADMSNPLYF